MRLLIGSTLLLISFDPTAVISPTAIIGAESPLHRRVEGIPDEILIGPNCNIGQMCIVHRGAVLEEGVILEDFVLVGEGVRLRTHCLIRDGTTLRECAVVGAHSIIGGDRVDFAPGVLIGNHVRCSGYLLAKALDPSVPIEMIDSAGGVPTVEDGAFIGWRAMILGPVVVGTNSYTTAGAIVTRDIPPRHIAYGVNQFVRGGSKKAHRFGINPEFFEKGCD